ncbi:MAG TPA: RidA family protein [Terriglobales bacterium]|nr:RidA family protein [Terriglobales bacterium]
MASAEAQNTKKFINVPSERKKPPFSDAVLVGETLYLSGHIGLDQDNKVPADAEAEARLVMQKFETTLKTAGMGLEDLVYVQVFCSDVAHFDTWNKVYRGLFPDGKFPARAFIGSGKLLFDARFEVQGIAVKKK